MIKHPCFNNDGELINKFVKYFEYDINENKDPLKYLYHIIGIANSSKDSEKQYVIFETVYPKNTFTKSEENKIFGFVNIMNFSLKWIKTNIQMYRKNIDLYL